LASHIYGAMFHTLKVNKPLSSTYFLILSIHEKSFYIVFIDSEYQGAKASSGEDKGLAQKRVIKQPREIKYIITQMFEACLEEVHSL